MNNNNFQSHGETKFTHEQSKKLQESADRYLLNNQIKITKMDIKQDDVIIFKFPETTSYKQIEIIDKFLKNNFKDNKVIGFSKDLLIECKNKTEAIKYFKNMIKELESN